MTKGCCGSKIKQVYWFYLEWINSQNSSWLFRHGQAGCWALGCHSTFQYEIRTTSTCTLERQTKVLPSSDDIHLTTFLTTHALSPCDRPCPPTLCNLHVCVFLPGLLTNKARIMTKQHEGLMLRNSNMSLDKHHIDIRFLSQWQLWHLRKGDGSYGDKWSPLCLGVCYENSSFVLQ